MDGTCKDDESSDELAECDAQDGVFLGGADCDLEPCPACPFNSPGNCQQVQTIFGAVPSIDREPANGTGERGIVLADDVKFGGSTVDEICWNTGFFVSPFSGQNCVMNIDTTWEIRIFGPDPDCAALPGPEVGFSTITLLNKVEGTGQGIGSWHYAGTLDAPIALPNGGLAGETYWFEVSCNGEPGCSCHATWSRDHGNEHHVTALVDPAAPAVRDHNLGNIGDVDVGFCENSGISNPGDVLGSCCTCSGCQESFTARECSFIRGRWLACSTCEESTCGGPPANDNCESPYLVSNVPESVDGLDVLTISDQSIICATDDGPGLSDDVTGGCAESVAAGRDMQNDIWYAYIATACGDLRIVGCNFVDMDQVLAVYDGENGCPLIDADEIACGDDTCGVVLGPADVTVRVLEGRAYLIRMGGSLPESSWGGEPSGDFDFNWSLTIGVCPVVEPPIRAPAPHDILKNRYISIDPRGASGTNPAAHHVRVALDSSQVPDLITAGPWWATSPQNGGGLSPATCISIVTTTKPASAPDWTGCPTVHLTGCPIIPTTTYAIAVEVGGVFSGDALLDTQAKPGVKWLGDVVGHFTGAGGSPPNVWTAPNGVVNADDFVAGLRTFMDPNAINATHLSVTDIHPVLNGVYINLSTAINDVLIVIKGFQGFTYGEVASPFPDDEIPDLTECP